MVQYFNPMPQGFGKPASRLLGIIRPKGGVLLYKLRHMKLIDVLKH